MSYPQYNSVAVCSEDGSIQLAAILVNGVYLSTNSGATWSQVSNTNLPTYNNYRSVAMSSDGSIQLAATTGDGVYLSTNSGATWSQVSNTNLSTDNNYRSVAMSSDGSIQLAGTLGDGVYLSTNSGATWSQVSNTNLPTDNNYTSVAMSSDGQYQLACVSDPSASIQGKVYKSIDYGNTWQIIPSLSAPGNTWYKCVYMSANGTIQVAVPVVDGIFISSDTGVNWAQISSDVEPLMNNNFTSGCCSSNGQYHYLAGISTPIIMSSNYGSTWTATGVPSYYWESVSTSSNGNVVLVGSDENGAYLSTNSGSTWSLTNPLTIPTNTTSPSIAGSTIVGNAIIAINGDWNGFPSITYNYQWYRSGSSISGATSSSYTTVQADIGLAITCDVTATNSLGSSTIDSSNSIIVVASSPPEISTAPVISGNALLGSTLTSTNGTWSNSPLSYTYQWYRGDNGIDGATSSSYTTVQADIGLAITCRVTASNNIGSSTPATSSNSIIVTLPPEPTPPEPTPPTPSRFTNLSNVVSITVDSNVEYMYALYIDLITDMFNIAKINANNGTIINRQFVILDSVEEGLGQILVVNNDLYVSKTNKYIYKITNINTTPSSPSIWFTSDMTQARLIGLATDGTYIYTTDTTTNTTNNCIMQVPLASSGTSSNTPWANLTYSPGIMTINNGYMYVTCYDDDNDNIYISKINMSLNPINPENTWVTIGNIPDIDSLDITGLAIYGSYMYVAVNYSTDINLQLSYIGLIYLSNGEGIIQNLNWVTIPNEFLSSNIIPGIYDVIITQKNQNVNLYTCDDIIQIPLYGSPVPPISNICFPAGTPVNTDQGIIPIEKINPNIHTINKKPIVDIIRTIYNDKYLIGFKKNAISINCPSQFTVMTKNHKIMWQGRKLEAESFLYRYENVVKVKYSGQILYNVLMEEHSEMVINNMVCETLDPNNTVAKLYKRTSKYTANDRYKISKFIAESVNNTKFDKNKTYKNIIKKL
jgi:hypothetical protein